MLYNEASIGLNIIVNNNTSESSAKLAVAKRTKPRNKYEKRRAKAAKAKQAKQQRKWLQQQQQSKPKPDAAIEEGPFGRNAGENDESSSNENEKDSAKGPICGKNASNTAKESVSEDGDSSGSDSENDNGQDDAGKRDMESSNSMDSIVAKSASAAIPVLPVEATIPDIGTKASSMQQQQTGHHQRDALTQAATQAYLDEFHAQPRDLDRRVGATACPVSQPSSHLTATTVSWMSLGLHPRLIQAVSNEGKGQATGQYWPHPTWIQSAAWDALALSSSASASSSLSSTLHQNVLLHSETGSGKTLAYLLPLLQSLVVDTRTGDFFPQATPRGPCRAMIIVPTRELAVQTHVVASYVCTTALRNRVVPGLVTGGGASARSSDKARLRKGVTVLIGTPGRLLDHLVHTECLARALRGNLEWIVLDEVDRLLDLGLGATVRDMVPHWQAANGGQWRTVAVSATATAALQTHVNEALGLETDGEKNLWKIVTGNERETSSTASGLSNATASSMPPELGSATPRQLIQVHMTVPAKLRFVALVACLCERAHRKEKTVVFCSTRASVDYYQTLLQHMDSCLDGGDETTNDTNSTPTGLFGPNCPIFKLHGSVPHMERQLVLTRYLKAHSAVLFCTDVAARGLNLNGVDWIVQYDAPCDVADYVHRAGRAARAGRAGHALLLGVPSEQSLVRVLKDRGVVLTPLSLATTLSRAATLAPGMVRKGRARTGRGRTTKSTNSQGNGDAFASELQYRLEDCVVQDDVASKRDAAAAKKANSSKRGSNHSSARTPTRTPLLELGERAFVSYIRAYPAKEKCIRHIFSAKALHLGHVARTFALKEPPKKLGAGFLKRNRTDLQDTAFSRNDETSSALSFHSGKVGNPESRKKKSKRKSTPDVDQSESVNSTAQARALLMANAIKLQNRLE